MASKGKMTRVDSSIPEESKLDDGIPITTTQDSSLPTRRAPSKRKEEPNALSLTSRMYDIDGDGKLDEAEKAMRDLAKEGQGTLSNRDVYKIVKESMNSQKELFKMKRVVIGLVGFALLLTLANLGTSFAAAFLAKDTTTTNNNLVDATTGETIATQTTADNFRISATADVNDGRRKLDRDFAIKSLVVSHERGLKIKNLCELEKTVTLTRTFLSGEHPTDTTNICPAKRVTIYPERLGGPVYVDVTITKEDGTKTKLVSDGTEYLVRGDNMLQGVEGPCDTKEDCASNLRCEAFVCREPLLPRECPEGCDYFFKQDAAWGEGTSRDDPINSFSIAIGLLKPGDTLYIMGLMTNPSYNPSYEYEGNIEDAHLWNEENTFSINNLHGEPNNYITIRSEDADPAILRGDGANILRVNYSSYLRILGFEIYGQVEDIPLSTAKALQFVYRNENGRVKYRVDTSLTDEEIGQLTMPILENISRPSYTNTRGAYFSNSNNLVIEENLVHHMPGGGLRVSYCEHVDIIGNEIHECARKSYSGTHGLVVENTQDNLPQVPGSEKYRVRILRNLVHHNYNEIYSWTPLKKVIHPKIDEGKGISLQRNQEFNNEGRILVANNIAYWNGFSGIHSNDGNNVDFIGNTAYMNSYTSSVMLAGTEDVGGKNIGISMSRGTGNVMANNIAFIDTSWGGFPIGVLGVNEEDVTLHNNLVYGEGTQELNYDSDLPNAAESKTYFGDPLFLLTLSHDSNGTFDFRVSPESPAVKNANTDFMLETDYFGNFRNITSPTIGAVEYLGM